MAISEGLVWTNKPRSIGSGSKWFKCHHGSGYIIGSSITRDPVKMCGCFGKSSSPTGFLSYLWISRCPMINLFQFAEKHTVSNALNLLENVSHERFLGKHLVAVKLLSLSVTMMDGSLGGVCARIHTLGLIVWANMKRGKLWDTSGWDTSDKEKKNKTMANRCCHINTITEHSMQNDTLIERLWSYQHRRVFK